MQRECCQQQRQQSSFLTSFDFAYFVHLKHRSVIVRAQFLCPSAFKHSIGYRIESLAVGKALMIQRIS
jgi:hypothetical protein